jgi:hypothetical protein
MGKVLIVVYIDLRRALVYHDVTPALPNQPVHDIISDELHGYHRKEGISPRSLED